MTKDVSIVPFGRYKGQPVEDMLADENYMTWVQAQPWFRERFLHMLSGRDADAASRTPVHNRLQTLFLNPDYQWAFLTCAVKKYIAAEACFHKHPSARGLAAYDAMIEREKLALSRVEANEAWEKRSAEKRIEELERGRHEFAQTSHECDRGISVGFESKGVDVLIKWWLSHVAVKNSDCYYAGAGYTHMACSHGEYLCEGKVLIEIKPSVGDDYPAILRQMMRNESEYLFTTEYLGEGATEAEFVAMFKASGKIVVFKRDVDREVAERMLDSLDRVGVQLSIQPSGKITVAPQSAQALPELAAARHHRDAIAQLLRDRDRAADDIAQPPQDDAL